MNLVFADTYYYLALLNRRDRDHIRASAYARSPNYSYITTAWVLTELADGLCAAPSRTQAMDLIRTIQTQRATLIIEPTPELFQDALALYAARPDKDWSLTDCTSFLTMSRYAITHALTADHHFEQAGFTPLLKT